MALRARTVHPRPRRALKSAQTREERLPRFQQSEPPQLFPRRQTRTDAREWQRRSPSSYVPAVHHLQAHHLRGLSVPSSGSSSTGDWVTRTEGLQLATPSPAGSPQEYQSGWGGDDPGEYSQEVRLGTSARETTWLYKLTQGRVLSQVDHMDADSPSLPDHSHLYAPPHPHQYQHLTSTHFGPPPPCPPSSPRQSSAIPPHYAPPLFYNLAGSSTSLSRSSSSNENESLAGSPHPLSHSSDYPFAAANIPQRRYLPTVPAQRVTMGYRPDCEKCVARVPGHYSHLTQSTSSPTAASSPMGRW